MAAVRPRRRGALRGAAALEFTLGLPIVAAALFGGIALVYAAFMKEKLQHASADAVRFCAVQPPEIDPVGCVRNRALATLANDLGRCGNDVDFRTRVEGDPDDPTEVALLQTELVCVYSAPGWPDRFGLTLSALAEMPILR